MTEREKVVRGLEQCLERNSYCGGCPYNTSKTLECMDELKEDAMALLAETAPRVMTLEEVENIPYGHVLIETDKADSLRWVDALLFSRNTNFSFDFITLEGRVRLLGSEYGRKWRCWTSRPTDE